MSARGRFRRSGGLAARNRQRAGWGEAAVKGMKVAMDEPVGDAMEDCVDTVANVLHYAKSQRVDPRDVLDDAEMHYVAERAGDDFA